MPSTSPGKKSVSGKTKQKTKNPLKSGNPAVVAAARAGQPIPKPRKNVSGASSLNTKDTGGSMWTPSGNPEPAKVVIPKQRTAKQKKNDRFRKAGQVIVVLFFLGSMILTTFAGLGTQTTSVPAPAETEKVLVDKDGNPLGGVTTPVTPATGVPAGGTEIPSTLVPGDGSSEVIEIPAG